MPLLDPAQQQLLNAQQKAKEQLEKEAAQVSRVADNTPDNPKSKSTEVTKVAHKPSNAPPKVSGLLYLSLPRV